LRLKRRWIFRLLALILRGDGLPYGEVHRPTQTQRNREGDDDGVSTDDPAVHAQSARSPLKRMISAAFDQATTEWRRLSGPMMASARLVLRHTVTRSVSGVADC
jgi:hypothetical protein